MRSTSRVAVAAALALASFASTAIARADDAIAPRVSITVDPLPMIFGRYGVTVDWLLAAHHALTATPHFDRLSLTIPQGVDICGSQCVRPDTSTAYDETFSGGGFELGYRHYSSDETLRGFFFGPSLLAATHRSRAVHPNDPGLEPRDESFSSWGFAFDAGGRIEAGGLVLGAGVGLQWTWATTTFRELPFAAEVIAGSGIRPRALAEIGGAF